MPEFSVINRIRLYPISILFTPLTMEKAYDSEAASEHLHAYLVHKIEFNINRNCTFKLP